MADSFSQWQELDLVRQFEGDGDKEGFPCCLACRQQEPSRNGPFDTGYYTQSSKTNIRITANNTSSHYPLFTNELSIWFGTCKKLAL